MNRRALLILDLINDVIHPDSPFAAAADCARENDVVVKANALAETFRRQGGLVIFFRVGFSEHYPECPVQHWSLLSGVAEKQGYLLGTWGGDFHSDLLVQPGDIELVKHRISPFYATRLEAILRGQCISRLVLAGVSTDYVVQSCAREAHDRDYETIVVGDACAAATPDIHLHAIESLARLVSVQTTSQMLA